LPPTTPVELTSALIAAGTLRQGAILTVEITRKFQSTVSNLWFLEVEYAAGSSPELPTRLVLKWPVEQSPAPERGEPELIFYRELAPALPSPPVVQCLATAPITSKEQWLILEDLRSSHTNPPWPHRPTDKEVYAAVAVLARFHAHWWEAPSLGSTIGTLHTEASLRTMVYGFRDHLPGFFDDLGDDLPVADRLLLEGVFNSSLRPWLRLLEQRALTVVHGDAHPWNFLFPRSGEGMPPYLIDWQLWHPDVGPKDLAFMLGLHWDRTARAQLELPLLHFYHQELISAGVSSYSFDDLMLDYRRCLVRNLTFPIIVWAHGDPRESWRHRLDHALAAYRDHNAAELL
jgi:aminoglycoside phosphotransferase (APT) family kinase protein